jgi:hypothetical protein
MRVKQKLIMNQKTYDDEQRALFVELAQQIGIGRAIRELGYPTYPTAQAWVRAAGVEPNVDTAYAQIKQWHTFYQVEDMLIVIDEGISVAQDMLMKVETADDMKKLSEAIQKLANTRLLLEGKSTSISEKREVSSSDLEIQALIEQQRALEEAGTSLNTLRVNEQK